MMLQKHLFQSVKGSKPQSMSEYTPEVSLKQTKVIKFL